MEISPVFVREWLDGEHRCLHSVHDHGCASCIIHAIWYHGYAHGRFKLNDDIHDNKALGWIKAKDPQEWICDNCNSCGGCEKCPTAIMWVKIGTDTALCSDCFLNRKLGIT